MKTAVLPPLRVDPGLRKDVEDDLNENETISKFTENAVCAQVNLRMAQSEFISRGLVCRDKAINLERGMIKFV